MLKIVVHDYAGHPFPLTLSRQLSLTNKVYHLYFGNDYGPKADFKNSENKNLNIESLGTSIPYNKDNFFMRFFNDFKYGSIVAKRIDEIKPNIIISGQCPTFAQQKILNASKKNNSKFIIWIQDFYSIAVHYILKRKFWYFAIIVSLFFKFYEKKQVKSSDHLIIISKEFFTQLETWKVNKDNITYIPNWGNVDHISNETSKDLKFLHSNFLDSKKFRLVYSGTLALKHDPNLILNIAKANLDIEILVVATGTGYKKLKENRYLPNNIKLLPIQPFHRLNTILNSADIFLAMISEDASKFSVPSKILNYFCAGKPIILSAPVNNLASQMILESKAGKTFDPKNFNDLKNFIDILKKDAKLRSQMSHFGRSYAEKNFDIRMISKKFENIFDDLLIEGNKK
jgi:colanic acid biosynthesis glycosyl transferase WcaI